MVDLLECRDGRDQKWETCAQCQSQVYLTIDFGLCELCWQQHRREIEASVSDAKAWFREKARKSEKKTVMRLVDRGELRLSDLRHYVPSHSEP